MIHSGLPSLTGCALRDPERARDAGHEIAGAVIARVSGGHGVLVGLKEGDVLSLASWEKADATDRAAEL